MLSKRAEDSQLCHCAPPDAAGLLTCHCEAPQEPWQSRRTGWNTGRPRRIRKCLLEIATSGLRPPRNDTGGRRVLTLPCPCNYSGLSQQSCLCLQRQDAQDALVDAGLSQRAVCGGIAHYFGVDSTLVRLIAVVLFFAGGLSLWVYIIAGLIMTETPDY